MKNGRPLYAALLFMAAVISLAGAAYGEPAVFSFDRSFYPNYPSLVKLRYRQADQKIAEALLAAVPQSIDLKALYGLEKKIVDMVMKQATVASKI